MKKTIFAVCHSLPVIGAIALVLNVSTALAATVTAAFPVTATVLNSCTVSTPSAGIGFGDYSATQSNAATITVSVTCTKDSSYTVGLSAGESKSIKQRTMKNGTNALNYNIYTTNSGTTIWGDSTTGSTQAGKGTGTAQAFTGYGIIPAGQNTVPAGPYRDLITAIVTY